MTGAEVAEAKGPVPALRTDAARTLNADDLSFPRVYIGQAISKAVEAELVKSGDLFLADSADDPEPIVLAKRGDEKGVVFYVLDLIKGKSRSIEGVLETWRYDDPVAPADAWTTYSYIIAIPDHDEDFPARLLLTKSNKPAARKINTVLQRQVGSKPYYECAFRLTTETRSNDKGTWYVARITTDEGSDEHIEVAAKQYEVVAANQERVNEAVASDDPSF